MQLAAGELPKRRRRKYRNHEKRLTTIKEKYEAGDYTLSDSQANEITLSHATVNVSQSNSTTFIDM